MVVCSDIPGNKELIDEQWCFKRDTPDELAMKIHLMTCNDNLNTQAVKNFENAKDYTVEAINRRRREFLDSFVTDNGL